MKKRGPKPLLGETMSKKVVTLDSITLRKLKVLGDGNVSAGVRHSADVAYARYQATKEKAPES